MARPREIPGAQPPCPSCGFAGDPTAGALNFCPACGADRRSGRAVERTAPDVFLDQVIADRYRLLELLGEGGMGAVYKAEHIRMGKALALKLLRGDFARDEGAVARFRSEAQIVSRLSHPHTIAVFDFGEIDEVEGFYLAMEYVPGRDLARALKESGPFEEARAAEIGQQILGSLAEAHDVGIVHRDMKPANVMLMQTRPGEDFAKVLDFGIAKLRDEGPPSASTTSAGAIVGTPSYLAPEQARGGALDARADLYAVGCLLYELVAGRPPFLAPSPLAVVSAHLHDAPPPLGSLAPGVSRRFAEVVHRALQKDPDDRFRSADDMRDALLAVGEPTSSRPLVRAAGPETTGELRIASRADFADFERQVTSLRRSRVAAPAAALLLAAGIAGAVWRWPDLYALAAARAPELARRVPAALRPSDRFDGAEHEPNDVAARANPLPLPPGADGAPAGGVAAVTGYVGEKLNETTGDVDVYRLVVPPFAGRRVLVADWRADGEADGIRGLDVLLSLNRERSGADGRTSAPLVASVDHGGAGRGERLTAAVEPGAYFLTVRERHGDATGPVEKPTDRYRLEVRLAEPGPGEEVEPDDGPDAVGARAERYPEWRAVAERNPLAEGSPAHGATAPEDPDVWAVAPRGPAEVIEVVAVVPDPALALAARRWLPDATDLAPPRHADRVRFEPAGEGEPGALLFVPVAGGAREGAPALVQLRAAEGEGRYTLVALGPGSASGATVLGLVEELARAGRLPAALELAAGFARHVPRAASRAEALVVAGSLAAAAAPSLAPEAVAGFDRAAGLLGAAIFEPRDGRVVYRAAFEARVGASGPLADAAALRVAVEGAPCTPEDVVARTEGFLARRPAPAAELVREARLARARALEARLWGSGGADRALLRRALGAWRELARGGAGEEANARAAALAVKRPRPGGAAPVCAGTPRGR